MGITQKMVKLVQSDHFWMSLINSIWVNFFMRYVVDLIIKF
ncbi:hypothetical protein SAMN00777080_0645 [Aquiflexum balticum DSM 16537]|uniref:Uncharacterized protein n=1 Tax=Aquiflexum balticum DSM 16537 TaxID=758820 RepID=A0A1W2H0F3_9BACT|nr:hypothetical protein SAMN00777080_0645 [Aquiflexum balticum DSM 16537]